MRQVDLRLREQHADLGLVLWRRQDDLELGLVLWKSQADLSLRLRELGLRQVDFLVDLLADRADFGLVLEQGYLSLFLLAVLQLGPSGSPWPCCLGV